MLENLKLENKDFLQHQPQRPAPLGDRKYLMKQDFAFWWSDSVLHKPFIIPLPALPQLDQQNMVGGGPGMGEGIVVGVCSKPMHVKGILLRS